jgi:hypothetical protein
MCVTVVVLVLRSVCHEFIQTLFCTVIISFMTVLCRCLYFQNTHHQLCKEISNPVCRYLRACHPYMQIVGNDKECVSVWSLLCVLCLWLLKCISRTETQLRRIALNH